MSDPTRPYGNQDLPPVRYARTFWAALLKWAGAGQVAMEDGVWRLRTPRGVVEIPASDVSAVHVDRGLVWSTLVLETAHDTHRFPGLHHEAANHLHAAFLLLGLPRRAAEAMSRWEELVARPRHLNHRAWSAWRRDHPPEADHVREASTKWLPASHAQTVRRFSELHDSLLDHVADHNRRHLERELEACAGFFDTVESKPLTDKQREALITEEDNTLVVAGAGTGKTSVVVGKVGYLVHRLHVAPSEILLLAYNLAAAEEMQERIDQRLGLSVKASTFHALGLGIIGEAEGRKPSLSKLAEQADEPAMFIEGVLQAMLVNALTQMPLLRHLVEYLRPYRRPEEFPNKRKYIEYLKGTDIRTIRQEQVRSHEECIIADWLFVNGIDYAYEHAYEHDVATPTRRQYKPDFFLPTSGVYIEHFGLSRDGSTAPWIDAGKYREDMEWKRQIHRQYGTPLVETFSYDRREGALTDRLAERLARVNVFPNPRPQEEVTRELQRRNVFSILAKLLATFLQHFKEGRHTLDSLRSRGSGSDVPRQTSFLHLFDHVHQAYEARLREERAIDFQDMIWRAADIVGNGSYRSPYRHIIVDEFQDLSAGRARLIQALACQAEDPRLTCVGDDWQSIYRFAGSDISFMTKFSHHFGYTASVPLDRTFRFGSRLLAASARFVQQNPAQLRKELKSDNDEQVPPIVIVNMATRSEQGEAAALEAIRGVLARISREHTPGEQASVYLLGRYNFSTPEHDMASLCRGIPRVRAEFLTVHRSKGLQADYVVLLNVINGRYGFPSEMADDPLLGLVLAEPDATEHAEERRLFYVALTRAKRRVFILSRETQMSPFVAELMQPEYAGLVEAPLGWLSPVPCKECGGSQTKRINKSGQPFWGCVNYPYCEGTSQVCAVCQAGAMVLDAGVFRCSDKGCAGREESCPKCRQGRLVRRTNSRTGSHFLGCTRWQRNGNGCTFTRPA